MQHPVPDQTVSEGDDTMTVAKPKTLYFSVSVTSAV